MQHKNMMEILRVLLLVCLWALSPSLIFINIAGARIIQKPLLASTSTVGSNYSVGFSLASSYGAAAVIIDSADGQSRTLTWVVQGDSQYRSVMARLSLESSRHLAPPYLEMDQYFLDLPRVSARRVLKSLGLPASHDVGVLASVLKELRTQIETPLEITLDDAVVASAHLAALYQDDIEDACTHAGVKYVIPRSMFQPLVYEPSSAYAGYGFGVCAAWRDEEACGREEFDLVRVLYVHYSPAALMVTPVRVRAAVGASEEAMGRFVSFELGSDAGSGYEREEEYWMDVKRAIVRKVREDPVMHMPERIILTGEGVDGKFRQVLEEAMVELVGGVPPISADDALVVAAKGAAEFRRRGKASWSP